MRRSCYGYTAESLVVGRHFFKTVLQQLQADQLRSCVSVDSIQPFALSTDSSH